MQGTTDITIFPATLVLALHDELDLNLLREDLIIEKSPDEGEILRSETESSTTIVAFDNMKSSLENRELSTNRKRFLVPKHEELYGNCVGAPHPRRTSLSFRQRSPAWPREENSLAAAQYHDYQRPLMHIPRSFVMYTANLQKHLSPQLTAQNWFVVSIADSISVDQMLLYSPRFFLLEGTLDIGFSFLVVSSFSLYLCPSDDQILKLNRFCGAFALLKCSVGFQLSARSNTCFGDPPRHYDFTSFSYCDCQ
jgi:hypothetical protein